MLRDIPWKRVWTLNIDDVLERVPPAVERKILKTFDWTDAYEPRHFERNELQLVYLHGRAELLPSKPDHLIFSIPEYAGRQESAPGWHTEFRSEFCQKPFIICGARLQDEYDLATVLKYGNRSRERGGCPSVLVLRSFASGQKERYERQGLIPVAADGKQFFDALFEDLLEWNKLNKNIDINVEQGLLQLKASFGLLSKERRPLNRGRKLNFYECAETQWDHIVNEYDAVFEESKVAAGHLTELSDALVTVALISGGVTSGKTAALYRAAALLEDAGFSCWLFRGEESFSVLDLISYAAVNDKLVLIFDDCANYSSLLTDLINEADIRNCQIKILATCDEIRLRAVEADLRGSDVRKLKLSPLKRKSFQALYQKRSDKGRLGRCANMREGDAWKEFNDVYSGHILEWLESLENSFQYRDAILDMFNGTTQNIQTDRDLIALIATTHRFGYSLPYLIFDRFKNKNVDEEVFSGKGSLSQLGYFDTNGVRLRSRAFALFTWEQITLAERYNWSQVVVLSLAPLIVKSSISKRTLPYQIVKSLMDWQFVKSSLLDRSEEWYGQIESEFGWNARFWEQRALLASDSSEEARAFSYAKKAVSLHSDDPFTHTTLGKVCVHIGVNRKDEIGVARFWEGVKSLETSRTIARDRGLEWEHPFMTFFTYALRAVEETHFVNEASALNDAWNDWMKFADSSRAFVRGSVGEQDLENYRIGWLRAMARKPRY